MYPNQHMEFIIFQFINHSKVVKLIIQIIYFRFPFIQFLIIIIHFLIIFFKGFLGVRSKLVVVYFHLMYL